MNNDLQDDLHNVEYLRVRKEEVRPGEKVQVCIRNRSGEKLFDMSLEPDVEVTATYRSKEME
jgi:hypothetical protein